MFRKILIAIDDSEQCQAALQTAAQLAMELGASLTLVHVLDLQHALVPEVAVFDDRLAAELRDRGNALLAGAEASLPDELDVARQMPQGMPADAIVQTARDINADLIVMGTHARGRLATLVLGSTAAEVLRRAPCPVVVVRQHTRPTPVPRSSSAPDEQPTGL
jgi:nucleotide-binding universal stress UspA family protein